MSLAGFLQSLRPSSRELWHAERRSHYRYLRSLREDDDESGWSALREMARCRDELEARGVKSL